MAKTSKLYEIYKPTYPRRILSERDMKKTKPRYIIIKTSDKEKMLTATGKKSPVTYRETNKRLISYKGQLK